MCCSPRDSQESSPTPQFKILPPIEMRPSFISSNLVESREAPTNYTVSLSSQRHNEKLPEGHRHKSREPWVFCHDSRKTSPRTREQ